MPTINIDLDFPDHPKTKILIALAGPTAPSCLVTLWCYAAKYHKADGDLSQYTAPQVETFAGWRGLKGKFYQALLDAKKAPDGEGFLDRDTKCLHDWPVHEGHLVRYQKRSLQGNEARWSRNPCDVDEGIREGVQQGIPQGVLNASHKESSKESLPESQSRAEQSSSEQRSREDSASVSQGEAASRSALRAGTEGRQNRSGFDLQKPTDTKPHTVGGIEYEKRIEALTTYLMDHCKIGQNGNRTPGVIAEFRLVAGRFEKILHERKHVLTVDELVAAARVAYVRARNLIDLQRFTTVLGKPAETEQVQTFVSKARNMVGRQGK